jgi:hypothetical protein
MELLPVLARVVNPTDAAEENALVEAMGMAEVKAKEMAEEQETLKVYLLWIWI